MLIDKIIKNFLKSCTTIEYFREQTSAFRKITLEYSNLEFFIEKKISAIDTESNYILSETKENNLRASK